MTKVIDVKELLKQINALVIPAEDKTKVINTILSLPQYDFNKPQR